jgi:GT2 family glycosyltransferase
MKIQIGIPTLNRADLLIPSILMYRGDFPNVTITIMDNGNQDFSKVKDLPFVQIIKNTENIGVAASWNKLCDLIFEKNDYALILNDDVYLGKRYLDIIELLSKKRNADSFLRATIDWCAFILPKKIYKEIGKFDECFYPAYYEDRSYDYRMKLKGIPRIPTPILNPYIYNSSKTLEKEPIILEYSKKNKEKYIEMWGGEPNKETFKKPYNK